MGESYLECAIKKTVSGGVLNLIGRKKEYLILSATSFSRGHAIYYNGKKWLYEDDNSTMENERPCKRCGKIPVNGQDFCIANLSGVKAACCGHGVESQYIIYKKLNRKEVEMEKYIKITILDVNNFDVETKSINLKEAMLFIELAKDIINRKALEKEMNNSDSVKVKVFRIGEWPNTYLSKQLESNGK